MLRHVKHAVDGTFFDRWLAYVRTAHNGTTVQGVRAAMDDVMRMFFADAYLALLGAALLGVGGGCGGGRSKVCAGVQRGRQGYTTPGAVRRWGERRMRTTAATVSCQTHVLACLGQAGEAD